MEGKISSTRKGCTSVNVLKDMTQDHKINVVRKSTRESALQKRPLVRLNCNVSVTLPTPPERVGHPSRRCQMEFEPSRCVLSTCSRYPIDPTLLCSSSQLAALQVGAHRFTRKDLKTRCDDQGDCHWACVWYASTQAPVTASKRGACDSHECVCSVPTVAARYSLRMVRIKSSPLHTVSIVAVKPSCDMFSVKLLLL